MVDGKVTAVLGTHTHVPTSDLEFYLKVQHIKLILGCVEITTLL